MALEILKAIIQKNFYAIQMGLGVIILFVAWIFFKPGSSQSRFKNREFERKRIRSKTRALAPIIKFGFFQPPHEILDVSPDATEDEIKTAYRELMKRYHPDKFHGTQPSEVKKAHKKATLLNIAKEKMLKNLNQKNKKKK